MQCMSDKSKLFYFCTVPQICSHCHFASLSLIKYSLNHVSYFFSSLDGTCVWINNGRRMLMPNLKGNIYFVYHFESRNYAEPKSPLQSSSPFSGDNNIAARNTRHLLAIIPKRFSDMRRALLCL